MATINTINNELDNLQLGNSYNCEPDDCLKYINISDSNINLLHINIRSVNKNFDQLQALLHLTNINFDIIILTECWLSKVNNLPVLDGFLAHSTAININQNDGVIIYIKHGLQGSVREPIFEGGNCLVCQIGKKLAVLAVYRSPSLNSKEQFDNFSASLVKIYDEISNCSSIALVGDLNIDISPSNRNDRSFEYLTINASYGLMPTHLFPTRQERCIDHILLKSNLNPTTLVLESHVTDHKPIVLSIASVAPPRKICPMISRLDYEAILLELEETDFTEIYLIDDVNACMNRFINIIKTVISKHTKMVKISRQKRTIKPWMTSGLLKCIKNRDKMHIKTKKAPNNIILKTTYTRYRNFCNNLLRKLKRAYEKTELEKAKNNPKTMWKTIKEITNTQKANVSPSELLGTIRDNTKASINDVNLFFSNVGKNLAAKIITQTHTPNTANDPTHPAPVQDSFQNRPVDSFALLAVDTEEVDSVILQLRDDCAVGWDGISASLLKKSRHSLVPPLTYLCNRCFQTGVFPDALKKAIIHPIHKGGNRDCVNNYRPISVLSTLSKVFEKILNKRLGSFLDKHKIIAQNQYGFRPRVSTEDAVLDLTQQVASKLDNKTKCLTIFLDLAKAFDTVSVPKLIAKLELVGIRGIQLEIFKSYLTNRTQLVKIDQYYSDEEPVTYGVPQGSILGPTLFLIYVNDLCRLSLTNCNIFAYADDTAILVYGPTWDMVKVAAEEALSRVMKWLKLNLLTLNLTKTSFIPFAIRSSTAPSHTLSVVAHSCSNLLGHCDCPALTRADSVKYLGVHIDSGLKWDKQIEAVSTRTMRLIHIFKSLRDSASLDTLRMVYFALCQSVLGYCITAWGGATKTSVLRVERAQRAILKVLCKKPYRYPTTELYSDCGVLTVRQLFVLRSILRTHVGLPPPKPNKRVNLLPRTQHKTVFAKHQFYILGTHIYHKVDTQLNIIKFNSHKVKSIVTEWLLQKDYAYTESLLTFIS